MANYTLTEDVYRRLRHKLKSLEKKLVKATGSSARRIKYSIKEIEDHIAACDKLFPEWSINFANFKAKKVDLVYPDLEIGGISELFKKFRDIFVLLVPDHTRKTFTRI